jgi:hypothetical protein
MLTVILQLGVVTHMLHEMPTVGRSSLTSISRGNHPDIHLHKCLLRYLVASKALVRSCRIFTLAYISDRFEPYPFWMTMPSPDKQYGFMLLRYIQQSEANTIRLVVVWKTSTDMLRQDRRTND